MERFSLTEIKKLAILQRGVCLSEKYINNTTPMKWKCKNKHTWNEQFKTIKKRIKEKGEWCPNCISNDKERIRKNISLQRMKELAKELGGECVSEEYYNANTKLKWRCVQGHEWEATPGSVKFGSWCRKCSGSEKRTIQEMEDFAINKGWKCISNEYHGNKIALEWECDKGHRWKSIPNNILRGANCPRCSGKTILGIDDLHNLAKKRGGKLVSTEYKGTGIHHLWECEQGHQWLAKPNAIQQGSWCPECNFYLSEEKCRYIINNLFNKKFKKTHKVIRPYELDGYNKTLKLAFEYHGIQHYEYRKKFYKTYDEFQKRKNNDIMKEQMCKEKEINLLVIPYYENNDDQKLIKYIINKCEELGYTNLNKKINLSLFYEKIPFWDEINELATKKNGKCLSKVFINTKTKMLWECEFGHQWEAPLNTIKNGHWCLICSGKEKGTIEEMREIAESKGGKCLSKDYVNIRTKLKWQCKNRHIWEATPGSIKKGNWCVECSGRKKQTIEQMQELAKSKGGKCLSTEYINANSKLKWECALGHQWEAKPGAVKFSSWCPHCSNVLPLKIEDTLILVKEKKGKIINGIQEFKNSKSKLTVECCVKHRWITDASRLKQGHWCRKCSTKNVTRPTKLNIGIMQQLAEVRRGKCLSKEYTNSHTKLLWECEFGHHWEAKPYNIKNNKSWCPECAKKKRNQKTKKSGY